MERNRVITAVLLAIFFTGYFSVCGAEEEQGPGVLHEIKLGVLAHDVDGLWSGYSREDGVDVNFEALFSPSLQLLGGALRPAAGVSVNSHGDTSKFYFDGIWQYDVLQCFYFAVGLGIAVHNGENHFVRDGQKALGSSTLFHFPIEVGYRLSQKLSLSVYFDHMSNANMSMENEGLDTLGLRLGYRL